MRGALLRSGKIEDYDALGEAGTAVHRMAQQLREAVRRQGPELVGHLAIPQINQAGDSIDWYAPQSGSVIPWSSSTEDERIPARAQMETWKAGLHALSSRLLNAHADTPNSDTALFAKLLGRVPHFPDESYVYLVDGTPVVTFWGFDHAGADRMRNPLLCLYSPPPAPTPASPLPTPAPVIAPVIAAQPWWKRWWWLLLLLPLLLLLLFGLRGCTGGLPASGLPSWLPFTASTPDLRAPQAPVVDGAPPQGIGQVTPGMAVTPGVGLTAADTATPAVPVTEPGAAPVLPDAGAAEPAGTAPEPTAEAAPPEPPVPAPPPEAEPPAPPSLDADAASP
ncbi:SrfA family protein, partial [Castellaniella sp.]|uniref:SrfA family protein n=3 Tax=Castellaniella sp. TaxID=1955812 RepID=UPI003C76519F